jgi:hypothetical protein
MAKRHLLMLGLLLGGGALSSACSDVKLVTSGDGDAGATGEAGAKGDAGSTSAAGEGGEAPFEFPESLNPQSVVVIGPAPETSTHLLVGGSDFDTQGEIVSITLASGAVGDSITLKDKDTVATSSAGVGFAIERTNDLVHLLDGGKISQTFNLKKLGTDTAPVDSKAYVPVLNQSLIVILDLSEGKVSRRIDLSEYNAPGDRDHSAEIAEGVYDPNNQIAYFVLQRIDRASYDANFHLPCSKNRALILGIDTATDEVVDLNGTATGKAIELELANPRSLSVNADGTTLYLLGDGCYEGSKKTHRGVEVVDLTNGTTQLPYEADGSDSLGSYYLSSMILTGGEDALIESYHEDDFTTHWTKFKLAAGTLGAEIAHVPQAVSFDGTDLLGVEVTDSVGKVVRYKLATQKTTVVSATSWVGDYTFPSSTALVQ